jgi:hypothetical protein
MEVMFTTISMMESLPNPSQRSAREVVLFGSPWAVANGLVRQSREMWRLWLSMKQSVHWDFQSCLDMK